MKKEFGNSITLHGSDVMKSDGNKVMRIILYFTFYDCEYEVYIAREDVEQDMLNFDLQGDSKLFDSFEELLEDDYWDELKDAFWKCEKEEFGYENI
jgi:hypothetical protein